MSDENWLTKIILERVDSFVFCYEKSDGQGFVNKEECKCFLEGEKCCQAFNDRNKFYSYFRGLSMEETIKNRDKIIKDVEGEFKDSKWFNNNVVKRKGDNDGE